MGPKIIIEICVVIRFLRPLSPKKCFGMMSIDCVVCSALQSKRVNRFSLNIVETYLFTSRDFPPSPFSSMAQYLAISVCC